MLTISFVPCSTQGTQLEEGDCLHQPAFPASQLRDAVGATATPAALGKSIYPLTVTPQEAGKDQGAVLLHRPEPQWWPHWPHSPEHPPISLSSRTRAYFLLFPAGPGPGLS